MHPAGHAVALWARDAQQAHAMQAARENLRYLRGVAFPPSLQLASGEPAPWLAQADLVIVGTPMAALREQLAQQQQRMTQLRRQREQLDKHLHAQRTELAQLLRAAYTVGEHAPLKLLLAQDTAAQAGRLLTYHGYLQRARAARSPAHRTPRSPRTPTRSSASASLQANRANHRCSK